MTTMGLEWLKHKESKRSNLAREQETNRHNVATERFSYDDLAARQNLGFAQLAETSRHNEQQEKLGFQQLAEQNRHNIQQEIIGHADSNTKRQEATTKRLQQAAQQKKWERDQLTNTQAGIDTLINSMGYNPITAGLSYVMGSAGDILSGGILRGLLN